MTRFPKAALATQAAALLILAACSSSSDNSNTVTADVRIVPGAMNLGFQAFSPDTFTVDLGTASSVSVSWRNDDGGIIHLVRDTATVPLFLTANITGGDTAAVTFNAVGSYAYRCDIHPTMQGLVIVTDTVP